MVNYTLTPSSPLNGLSRGNESFHIEEVSKGFLYSLACHQSSMADVKTYLKKQKLSLPEVGHLSTFGECDVFSSGRDQWFIRADKENPVFLDNIRDELKEKVAITDQTDAWVQLQLSGSTVREKLERLCPLDLHPDVFAVGNIARTTMEHLNVIILREGENTYTLMSARSSSKSFIHMFL